jgi:ABC-type antimicrobial peptide transport system permease subunit
MGELIMTLRNTLLTALRGVSSNKLRAALTTLGVIIGVASVIAMLALGNGARAAVESRFRFLGSDQVQIFQKMMLDDGEFTSAGKILSYEDGLNMPEAVELVDSVDMSVNGSGKVRFGRATLDMNISGVTADSMEKVAGSGEVQPVDWPEGEPLSAPAFIDTGRFFTPAEVLEGADVCVLGYETALDLFGGDNPVGATLWIDRQRYLVIGVLAELESTNEEERYRSDPNESLNVPISSAIRNLFEEEPAVSITAHVTDESRMDQAKEQIKAYLRERHGIPQNEEGIYEDDFETTTRNDILGAQQDAARTFSLLLAAMAAVSLVVGGIGIMNVMLVSVSERTREIGIRMAVGARQWNIVTQFLLESILISAGGGALGIAAGVLVIPLAATLNQGMAVLDPASIPLAFGVALFTGIVFGLYPALRASRLDPIQALRYE